MQALPTRRVGTLNMVPVIWGMWQVSGGWFKLDKGKAVEHMKRLVEQGFTRFANTFDSLRNKASTALITMDQQRSSSAR
jgi:hypothetical protein